MTLFIIAAVLLSLLAAAFVAQPLWRARGAGARAPQMALAAAVALIGAAALLYLKLGDRGWSDRAVMAQTNQSISVLASARSGLRRSSAPYPIVKRASACGACRS